MPKRPCMMNKTPELFKDREIYEDTLKSAKTEKEKQHYIQCRDACSDWSYACYHFCPIEKSDNCPINRDGTISKKF